MLDVIIRFLTFEVISTHPLIPWALATTWLILLISAFLSIASLDGSRFAKTMWGLLVVLLPIIGLFIYALRCLIQADWSILKPFLPQSRPNAKTLSKGH